MIKLFLRNVSTRVELTKEREQDWLNEILSVPIEHAKYTPAFRKGHWDGIKHFFNVSSSRFPTGLLPTVLEENKERKHPFKVKVRDKRRSLPVPRAWKPGAWLKYLTDVGIAADPEKCKYQELAMNAVLTKTFLGLPWPRGIMKLPTGSGKTLAAGGVLHAYKDSRALFLCDRLDPVYQASDVFSKILPSSVGIVGGGRRDGLQAQVCVGTPQSLRGIDDEWLRSFRVLVVDECHKVGDNEYAGLLSRIPAYVRLGLSATALARGDVGDVLLVGATGDILYEIRTKELLDRGQLATPVVELIPVDNPDLSHIKVKIKNPDQARALANKAYRRVYVEGIVKNDERNRLVVERALRHAEAGRPTMILAKLLDHLLRLGALLDESSVSYGVLSGKDEIAVRRSTVASLRRGEFRILLSSTIFDEAVDIPEVRALILAGGGNSPIKAMQRVGRGMRAKSGDNRVYVHDFMDRTHKMLHKNSLQRVAIYRSQGFELTGEYGG